MWGLKVKTNKGNMVVDSISIPYSNVILIRPFEKMRIRIRPAQKNTDPDPTSTKKNTDRDTVWISCFNWRKYANSYRKK